MPWNCEMPGDMPRLMCRSHLLRVRGRVRVMPRLMCRSHLLRVRGRVRVMPRLMCRSHLLRANVPLAHLLGAAAKLLRVETARDRVGGEQGRDRVAVGEGLDGTVALAWVRVRVRVQVGGRPNPNPNQVQLRSPSPEATKRGTSGAKALEARKVSVDAVKKPPPLRS
eukprot:scaffold128172_cov30-Phaeocystis_antarctica.AAC.1